MMVLALLLAGAPLQDRAAFPGGEDDGTRTTATDTRCDTATEDIVVCGTADPDRFRLKKIAPRYVEPPVRATTQLGPGELSVEAEQRSLPGAESPAAMVRFRMPLGRKNKK